MVSDCCPQQPHLWHDRKSHRNPWTLSTNRSHYTTSAIPFWEDHNSLRKFRTSSLWPHLKTNSGFCPWSQSRYWTWYAWHLSHDERTMISSGNSYQNTFSLKLIIFWYHNSLFSFSFFISFVEKSICIQLIYS